MTYRARCEGRRSEQARKVARRERHWEREWERFSAQLKALPVEDRARVMKESADEMGLLLARWRGSVA